MAPYKSSAGRNLGKLVKSYLTGNIGSGLGGAPVGPGTLTLTVIKPDTTSETINISSGGEFNFNTAGPYTITAATSGSPVTVDMLMWGAGGTTVSGDGGAGGFTSGKFTFNTGSRTYYVIVGAGGGLAPVYNGSALPSTIPHSAPIPYGGGGTGSLPSSPYTYHGGGFSGFFEGNIAHADSVMIAGGGGGAASTHEGGAGGGTTAETGNGGGGGGTQSAGGAGGPAPGGTGSGGTALAGGGGHFAGGGGGGGYYGGGGGGGSAGQGQQTSGGGGSGYFDPALVTSGSTETGNYGTVANASSPYRNGAGGVATAPQPGTTTNSNGSPGRVVIGLSLGL